MTLEKVAEKPTESFRTIHQCDSESKDSKKPSHWNETTYIISVHIGSNLNCSPNRKAWLCPVFIAERLLTGCSPKTTVNLTGNQIFDTELYRISDTTKERLTSI